jgi:hypothetical protein
MNLAIASFPSTRRFRFEHRGEQQLDPTPGLEQYPRQGLLPLGPGAEHAR